MTTPLLTRARSVTSTPVSIRGVGGAKGVVVGGVKRQFFSPLLPIKRNLADEMINEEGVEPEKGAESDKVMLESDEAELYKGAESGEKGAESSEKGAESTDNEIHNLMETIQRLQTNNNELINKLEVRNVLVY